MLVSLVPMFDKDLKVSAYSLLAQKDNYLLNPSLTGIERHAMAAKINGVEVLNEMGVETLSPGTDIFLPISKIAIFTDIPGICHVPHDRLVLLLEDINADESYAKRLIELKSMGYRLALKNLPVASYVEHASIIKLIDYIMLDCGDVDVTKAKIFFTKAYPHVKLCVTNITNQEYFDAIKGDKEFLWFEGPFYRVPVTKGQTEVAPLKATYLQLLNVVNDDDFELTDVADVISRDTALTLSFLKMVGATAGAEITSIRHAAAMLGQAELKKWINAVVTKELCADRPSEVMRISLLRAKFAERLATIFEMGMSSQELFLTGLFSVLDLILECPMADALGKIKVSKDIKDALIDHKGKFAKILHFVVEYEAANWQEISRIFILENIEMDDVYEAYINAIKWYHQLLG